MKRIAIDMDDVMADTTFKIIQYINERISSDYTYDGLMTANDHVKKAFYESYIANNDFLWEPGFFEDIPVKPDAVEVIQALQDFEAVECPASAFGEALPELLEDCRNCREIYVSLFGQPAMESWPVLWKYLYDRSSDGK